ncbi:tyrosyl-tRNA synthetase [Hyphomicrobium methylovorum]|uniref:tyrosyl-tRNA synthetase n=1 Tax=Hyphomicrobium methylovorum TaxID=84 RepID=UPI0015E7AC3F|nr:tyrosyl-tRNA synthetase [Hyphomicrobium methylovorum]
MLKKVIPAALASIMAVSALVPATTTPAEARRGGAIVAGALIGLTAGAIIANSSRADAYERSRWRDRCDRWHYRCNRGDDRACYAFDNNCG